MLTRKQMERQRLNNQHDSKGNSYESGIDCQHQLLQHNEDYNDQQQKNAGAAKLTGRKRGNAHPIEYIEMESRLGYSASGTQAHTNYQFEKKS